MEAIRAFSELSGKSNVEFKAREFGIDLKDKVNLSKEIINKIKKLEDQGFQFEAAEGSFELILREATGEYKSFFKLENRLRCYVQTNDENTH